MSKFTSIVKTLGNKTLNGTKKYSPEILTIAGITVLIGAGVLACKSSMKLKEERKKIKEDRIDIQETRKLSEEMINNNEKTTEYKEGELYPTDEAINEAKNYLESGYKRDIRKSYKWEILTYAKLYGPAVGLAVAGTVAILAGHSIMRKRAAALAAAYTALERSYAQYRKKVIDTYGKEIDEKFRKNIIGSQEVEVTTTDEDGNEKTSKETIDIVDTSRDYTILFDATPKYQRNPYNNRVFLKGFERMLNDQLYANGLLLLNDVYDQLGIPRTSDGAVVGWSAKDVDGRKVDGYVDLGLDFNDLDLDHWESDIWLNPNCDGFVQHLISD